MMMQVEPVGNESEARLINEVRSNLNQHVTSDHSLMKHAMQMMHEFQTNDDFVWRYLKRNNHDIEKTVKHCIRAMRLLVAIDYGSTKKSHFPPQLFLCAPLILYGADREGNPCLYGR